MTNKSNTVIYTGVTSDLKNRVIQHKTKYYKESFTAKYNCNKLVFCQEFNNMSEAIEFEKKLKAGSRVKKENLINDMNPNWIDLYDNL